MTHASKRAFIPIRYRVCQRRGGVGGSRDRKMRGWASCRVGWEAFKSEVMRLPTLAVGFVAIRGAAERKQIILI